jgi:aminoglycoside phosphotransferase (APT) family kinase protein
MIAKLPTQGEGRELFIAGGIYATEGLFYRDLAAAVPLRVPRCYYNGMDLAAGQFALLLEDLAPARQGDQIASCSRAEAEMVVEGLATLHAAFWNSPRLDDCAWLRQYAENRKGIVAFYPYMWSAAESRVGDLMSPKVRAIAASLQPHLAPAYDALGTPPVTLVHGDYRLDNIILAPSEPKILAVLDWELSTLGDPLADLAYHLMQWDMPPSETGAGVGTLLGHDLGRLGIPTRAAYVDAYVARTGLDPRPHLPVYLAYNFFRLAAILQGIVGRVRAGTATSENAAAMAPLVRPLAVKAWEFAREADGR